MKDSTSVLLTDEFFKEFQKLPNKLQNKTWENIKTFISDKYAPNIHFESINYDNRYSIRADEDEHRRIILYEKPERKNEYWLITILPHDKAYQRARRVNVDPTKLKPIYLLPLEMEIYHEDLDTIDCIIPFIDNESFKAIGATETDLEILNVIKNKKIYSDLRHHIPNDFIIDVLDLLIEDDVNIRLALETLDQAADDYKYGKDTNTLDSFTTIRDEDIELRNLISNESSLRDWRKFLYYPQSKIVNKDYNGPFKISGGAGTGKSIICIFRAVRFLEEINSDERILFTFFNEHLEQDTENILSELAKDLSNIDILRLDKWVQNYIRNMMNISEFPYKDSKEVKEFWKKAIQKEGLEATAHLNNKIRNIYYKKYLPAGQISEAEFISLFPEKKSEEAKNYWNIIQNYLNLLNENNVLDLETAKYKALVLLKEDEETRYRHIIVDEAQDLSNIDYKIIRTLAGEEKENDIFLAGDSKQKIYDNNFSLSQCGINIKGRSRKLTLNYRTTKQIQDAAEKMISGAELEKEYETGFAITNYENKLEGSEVFYEHFDNQDDEVELIQSKILELQKSGINPNEICILLRTSKDIQKYTDKLEKGDKKVKLFQIQARGDDLYSDKHKNSVRISTLHRAKGLEFKAVFIPHLNDGQFPFAYSSASAEEEKNFSKKLLYTGMTRARDHLYLTSYDTPSPLLDFLNC